MKGKKKAPTGIHFKALSTKRFDNFLVPAREAIVDGAFYFSSFQQRSSTSISHYLFCDAATLLRPSRPVPLPPASRCSPPSLPAPRSPAGPAPAPASPVLSPTRPQPSPPAARRRPRPGRSPSHRDRRPGRAACSPLLPPLRRHTPGRS